MSFEEFRIFLQPFPESVKTSYDGLRFQQAIEAVQKARPDVRYDELEVSRLYPPTQSWQPIFFHESTQGLFQIFFSLQGEVNDELWVFMTFGYSNPRSVYVPFCEVAGLLMRMFDLQCRVGEFYPPEMKDPPRVIDHPDCLLELMAPSMNYNKGFWHEDVQTTEEAILRPGDAVERFLTPDLYTVTG